MTANKKLEVRIKDAIRPIFTPFQDEDLLDAVSQRIIQKVK